MADINKNKDQLEKDRQDQQRKNPGSLDKTQQGGRDKDLNKNPNQDTERKW